VVDQFGAEYPWSELTGALKELCAFRHIAYDSSVVRKALESAIWQRDHRSAEG